MTPRHPRGLFESAGFPATTFLAECWYDELMLLNRCSISSNAHQALEKYLGRFAFGMEYLRRMEGTTKLRFAPSAEPALCWVGGRCAELPMAGEVGSTEGYSASEVFLSTAVALDPSRRLWAIQSCVRTILFLTAEQDLDHGLHFITRCAARGLLNLELVLPALQLILAARGQVESDGALVRKLLDGEPPNRFEDWRSAAIAPDAIGQASVAVLANSRKAAPPIDDWVVSVADSALELVESTRKAASYGEWLTGYMELTVYTRLVASAARFLSDVPLPVRTTLSQLEEIKADAGLLSDVLGSGDGLWYRNVFQRFGFFAGYFRMVGGDSLLQRILEQRLLIPDAIRPHANLVDVAGLSFYTLADLPDGWAHIGWQSAHVVAAFSRATSAFDPPPADIHSAISEHIEAGRYHDAITQASKLLKEMPWSPELRGELAIALDSCGQSEAALEHILAAVFLRPTNPLLWQSFAVISHKLKHDDDARMAAGLAREAG